MSELLEKLKKRRDVVDNDGLHFESSAKQPTSGASVSKTTATVRSFSPAAIRLPAGNSGEFKEALNRRRAHVDSDGATWESKPLGTRADASSALRAQQFPGGGYLKPRTASSTDFRERIEQQRERVDTTSKTWQNDPSQHSADCLSGRALPQAASGQLVRDPMRRTGSGDSAVASSGSRGGSPRRGLSGEMDAPVAGALPEAAAAAPAASEEQPPAAGEVTTQSPSAAGLGLEALLSPSSHGTHEDDDNEDHIMSLHSLHTEAFCLDGDGDGQSESDKEGEPEVKVPSPEKKKRMTLTPDQVIKIKGTRITWLVDLCRDQALRPTEFESPVFPINKYGGVRLKLKCSGSRSCSLILSGPAPRPAGLGIMLFAAKGWNKRTLRPWPEGEDFVQQFDVPLGDRDMLLCGLVFGAR